MELPSSFELLGITIHINLTDERQDVWGEWDSESRTILINSKATKENQCITFMHELIHAIDDLLGLDLEHRDVYAVSQVLWAVLRNNPSINAWINTTLSKC
tara:strand:+ start:998 stop:1300 length:303 start_codon:yes stop_codon:yes gene_type:complete